MSDTLHSLCETLYFPLRLKIKEPTRYQYRVALRDYARFLGREPTTDDLDDDRFTLWMRRQPPTGRDVKPRPAPTFSGPA